MARDGAASLGRAFGVSELTVGLTVVAFGTSAPELFVNIISSMRGAGEIVLGNIIGSNIMNTALVLGAAGVVAPLGVTAGLRRREIPYSILGGVLVFLFAAAGGESDLVLGRLAGVALLLGFALFIYAVFRRANTAALDGHLDGIRERGVPASLGLTLLGCAALGLGGKLVVDNAVDIAQGLGVSQALIGLTLVAVGTSVPEMAASVTAALRGRTDMAVGNVVGSNIYNIYLILGASAVVRPVVYGRRLLTDVGIYIGCALLFWAFSAMWKNRLERWQAGVLLAVYAGYAWFIIARG